MKKKFLFIALSLVTICYAQKKAVTETGEEVILNENGTWEYSHPADTVVAEIKTNPTAIKKSATASFLLKSTKNNIGIWLDPKKWKFGKATNNPAAEFELQLKGQSLYGMLITEKIEIPITTLRNLALEKAKSAAPDIKIIREEYRTVNGLKVLFLQMAGTTQGIKFVYYGYYYSSTDGTLQLVTYTTQNLLKTYLKDAEEILSGLVTTN